MDIKRLESFSKVYELQSISGAAQALHLSQPSISTHISFLETELTVPLFDRIGREIIPTQAGEILYKYAQELISLKNTAYTEVHELYHRIVGRLQIGGSTIPGHYLLPEIFSKYKQIYKQVDISLEISDSLEIENKVLSCEIDLGVIGASREHPEIYYYPIMQDNLIVLGKTYLLSNKTELNKQELVNLPWIIREKGSGTRKAMERGLQSLGLKVEDLNIQARVDSTESVLKCVQAGLGVGITSRLAAEELLSQNDIVGSKFLDLNLKRYFYAIYHKQRKFFPASKYFWEVLTNWASA